MIFLDTSAIYAWADGADLNHKAAVRYLHEILRRGERLLTHNYVLLESITLVQARLGLSAAAKLISDSSQFEIDWVDRQLHEVSTAALAQSAKRGLSLVDCVSFQVMKRRKVTTAFAFDRHFKTEGFILFGG
jgi:predicted nucleic acid-binding protein